MLLSSAGHYVLCDFGSAAGVIHTKVNVQQLQEEIARSDVLVVLFLEHIKQLWLLGC